MTTWTNKGAVALLALTMSPAIGFSAAASSTQLDQLLAEQPPARFNAGKATYEKYCAACHAPSNIMVSSPKLGDRADWQGRLSGNMGFAATVANARKGKNAMPANGLCHDCTAKALEAAILYMMKGE